MPRLADAMRARILAMMRAEGIEWTEGGDESFFPMAAGFLLGQLENEQVKVAELEAAFASLGKRADAFVQVAEDLGASLSQLTADAAVAKLKADRWDAEGWQDLDVLRDRIATLERENSALAADQCHAGYGDEYGNHRCREVDALRAVVEMAAGRRKRPDPLIGLPEIATSTLDALAKARP